MPKEAVVKFIKACKAGQIGGEGSLGQRIWKDLKEPTCEKWAEAIVSALENSGVKFSTPAPQEQYITDDQYQTIFKTLGEEITKDFVAGAGQGVGGQRQGDGGQDQCKCPKCGATAPHERGTPCNEQKCPKCGALMAPGSGVAKKPAPNPPGRGKVVFSASDDQVNDDSDHFPINDVNQAKNTLRRSAQYDKAPSWYAGTLPALVRIIRTTVKDAYPNIPAEMAVFYSEPETYNELFQALTTLVGLRYPGKKAYIADLFYAEKDMVVNCQESGAFRVPYETGLTGIILAETIPLGDLQKEYADELDTVDIKGVEIFMAGAIETPEYTAADAARIAANYHELAAEIKPPIYTGHTRTAGWPAFGWVENVRAEGVKILGDFKAVPKIIAGWIKNRGYRRISAEIKQTYKSEGGKTFSDVLYGVALLGQDVPRLKLLRDLPIPKFSELPDDITVVAFSVEEFNNAVDHNQEPEMGGEKKMPKENVDTIAIEKGEYADLLKLKTTVLQIQKDLDATKTLAEELVTAQTKITSLEADLVKAGKSFSEVQGTVKGQKIASAIETMTKSGKITAAEGETIKAFAEGLDNEKVEEFGEGEEKTTSTQMDRYLAQFEARKEGTGVDYSEQSRKGDHMPTGDEAKEAEQQKRVAEYQEKHPEKTYAEALSEAWTEEDENSYQGSIS